MLKEALPLLFLVIHLPFLLGKDYPSPNRFQGSIDQFSKMDAKSMPPEGAVVVTGSSSIRMWHKQIRKHLAPLTVIPRGFGGSNMNDALHYADELILKYKPRAVAIYEGDNDTGLGIDLILIQDRLQKLLKKIKNYDSKIRIYLISVKPSISRLSIWPKALLVNKMYQDISDKDPNIHYVDVASALLEDGKPMNDIFIKDNLHLNKKGYEKWAQAVRKVLMPIEEAFEK